jgi:multisubunit Na+/H+ antiporter MnhE subunit
MGSGMTLPIHDGLLLLGGCRGRGPVHGPRLTALIAGYDYDMSLSGGLRSKDIVAVIMEAFVWSAAMLGVWLLSLSAVSGEDLWIGSGCALVCGVVAVGVRRAITARSSATTAAFFGARPALLLPLAIAADTAGVLAASVRGERRRARLTTVKLPARGATPRATTRRAIATVLISASPGSIVVDANRETGVLTVHTFGQTGPFLPDRFTRA